MIGKHLKEFKKNYLLERKKLPPKARISKNRSWKKRWLPFIKYDHDFDGGFFLDIIVYKLHIMLDYYEHGKYCMQADECRLEVIKSLKEACRLGDMLIADEFERAAYEIMEAHMHISSKPSELHKDCRELIVTWDSPEDEALYEKARKAGEEFREDTLDKFFKYLRDHYREWWD